MHENYFDFSCSILFIDKVKSRTVRNFTYYGTYISVNLFFLSFRSRLILIFWRYVKYRIGYLLSSDVTSHPVQLSLAVPPWVGAMSSSCSGLMWLTGAVVCLPAAPRVQLFVSVDSGRPHNVLWYH